MMPMVAAVRGLRAPAFILPTMRYPASVRLVLPLCSPLPLELRSKNLWSSSLGAWRAGRPFQTDRSRDCFDGAGSVLHHRQFDKPAAWSEAANNVPVDCNLLGDRCLAKTGAAKDQSHAAAPRAWQQSRDQAGDRVIAAEATIRFVDVRSGQRRGWCGPGSLSRSPDRSRACASRTCGPPLRRPDRARTAVVRWWRGWCRARASRSASSGWCARPRRTRRRIPEQSTGHGRR